MARWAWIVCVAIVLASGHQLWRAMTLGTIKYGAAGIDFDRSTSPVFFWFLVGLALVGVLLFGGAILLIAVSRLVQN